MTEDNELVDERGPQKPEPLPAARGSEDGFVQKCKASESSQAADELVVLHDGQIGEAAQFIEGPAADEQRLVSIRHPPKTRTQVGRAFDQRAAGKRISNPEPKCAADNMRLAKCRENCVTIFRRQQRVGMEE